MKRYTGKYGQYSKAERIPLDAGHSAETLRQLAMERGFNEPKPQGPTNVELDEIHISDAEKQRIEDHCAEQYTQLVDEFGEPG